MSMDESKRTQLRIYLASPYGFSAQWQRLLLPEFITALESLGLEVWEPFQRNGQVDLLHPGWAYQVGQRDLQDVMDADALFAIMEEPPDEGVMVELGAAIALGKPTFLFRDDFRLCTDSEDYPLNLMLFSGLPAQGWQDFVYTSLEEVVHQDKALYRWAQSNSIQAESIG